MMIDKNIIFLNKMNKRMKKRGFETDFVVKVVVMLVIILIFIFILAKYKGAFAESTAEQVCKNSIYASSISNVLPGIKLGNPDIKCPMQNVTIEGGKREIILSTTKYMYGCWDMYYDGQKELFQSGKESTIKKVYGQEQKFCAICYKIKFKHKDIFVPADEILLYQVQNTIPKDKGLPQEQKRTYQQYFSEYVTDKSMILEDIKQVNDKGMINSNEEYAIIYTMTKKDYLSQMEKAVGASVGGAVGTTIIMAAVFGTGVLTGGLGLLTIGVAVAAGGGLGYAVLSEGNVMKDSDWVSAMVMIPYEPETLKNLNCTYVPAMQGNYLEGKAD